ncbi:DUF5999 family protein [Streptomyces rhizosphaerihabitans]|nr:DUF5999 family protein [Streptomyces rhizosphaerihabitans]
MCSHRSSCPSVDAAAPHIVSAHPEQGWCVNCTFL